MAEDVEGAFDYVDEQVQVVFLAHLAGRLQMRRGAVQVHPVLGDQRGDTVAALCS